MSTAQPRPQIRERLQNLVPKLVLAPSFLLVLIFVYGFNLWTLFLSFTNSKAFATTKLVGLLNYEKLWNWTFETDPPSNWYTAIVNMGIFGGLYVVFCLFLGLTLAILLDQKIRGEGIPAADLSLPARALLHRDRHGVEAVSRSRHRARKGRPRLGLDELSSSTGSSIRG